MTILRHYISCRITEIGCTAPELAARIGMSEAIVEGMLAGTVKIPLDRVEGLCVAIQGDFEQMSSLALEAMYSPMQLDLMSRLLAARMHFRRSTTDQT